MVKWEEKASSKIIVKKYMIVYKLHKALTHVFNLAVGNLILLPSYTIRATDGQTDSIKHNLRRMSCAGFLIAPAVIKPENKLKIYTRQNI